MAWSDECAVQKDSDTHNVSVLGHQNNDEQYASKNIRGKTRDGEVSQIIWGCFVGDKLGPIAFIDGIVNTDVYMTILTETFHSSMC